MDQPNSGYKEKWLNLKAGFHRYEMLYFEIRGDQNVELGLKDALILLLYRLICFIT